MDSRAGCPRQPGSHAPRRVRGRLYWALMSKAVTLGIQVEVESTYMPERSAPQAGHYFFAYRVRISNVGSERAQLKSRRWIITDGDGNQQVVEGPGVVGEQPDLPPGRSFEYTSFCPLSTPVGTMHGAYQMVTASGAAFDAEIAPFSLAMPSALN
jgi:ApaG protein